MKGVYVTIWGGELLGLFSLISVGLIMKVLEVVFIKLLQILSMFLVSVF